MTRNPLATRKANKKNFIRQNKVHPRGPRTSSVDSNDDLPWDVGAELAVVGLNQFYL